MLLTRMQFSTSLLLLQPRHPLQHLNIKQENLLITQAIAERFSAVVDHLFQHLRRLECYTIYLATEAIAPHLASLEKFSTILEDH